MSSSPSPAPEPVKASPAPVHDDEPMMVKVYQKVFNRIFWGFLVVPTLVFGLWRLYVVMQWDLRSPRLISWSLGVALVTFLTAKAVLKSWVGASVISIAAMLIAGFVVVSTARAAVADNLSSAGKDASKDADKPPAEKAAAAEPPLELSLHGEQSATLTLATAEKSRKIKPVVPGGKFHISVVPNVAREYWFDGDDKPISVGDGGSVAFGDRVQPFQLRLVQTPTKPVTVRIWVTAQ